MKIPAEKRFHKGNRIKRLNGRLMVYLSKGQVALADPEDEQRIRDHTWCAMEPVKGYFYAYKSHKAPEGKTVGMKMHQMILPKIDGMVTDHKNGNTLDNRRVNIRYATRSQNCQNVTKRSSGVYFYKHLISKPWMATITINRKSIYLGHFETREQALSARKSAEILHFKDFAPQR